jgi:hypothetical protein
MDIERRRTRKRRRRSNSITKPRRTERQKFEYVKVRPQIRLFTICAPHTAGSPTLQGICMKRLKALLASGFTRQDFLNKQIFNREVREPLYQNFHDAYQKSHKTWDRKKTNAKHRMRDAIKKIDELHKGHVLGNIVRKHHLKGWRNVT